MDRESERCTYIVYSSTKECAAVSGSNPSLCLSGHLTFQHFNISTFQHFNLSTFQDSTSFQNFNISAFQHFNFSLQRVNLQHFNISTFQHFKISMLISTFNIEASKSYPIPRTHPQHGREGRQFVGGRWHGVNVIFQVAPVDRPLLAVCKLIHAGRKAHFGSDGGEIIHGARVRRRHSSVRGASTS